MRVTSVMFLSVYAISSYAAPTSNPSGPELAITPMHFSGQVVENGPWMELTGSVQEIMPDIQALNPGWAPDLNTTTTSPNESALVARYFKGRPICGDVPKAQLGRLREGVDYLRALGNAKCGAEANSCARISCSWNAGIFLCNHRNYKIDIACKRAGDAAQEIMNDCEVVDYVRGEWFDTNGYSIFIGMSAC